MSNREYDYYFKLVIIGNSGVGKSSQERFRTITNAYYKGADAYSNISQAIALSLFMIILHVNEIQKHAGKNTTILLIGNKSDLSNKTISAERAQVYAKDKLMLFQEISAKTSYGVSQAFEELSRLLIIKRDMELKEKKQKKNLNIDQTTYDVDKKQSFNTKNKSQENINLQLWPNRKLEDGQQQQKCNC